MILKPRYLLGSGASHNKKAPESIRCFLASYLLIDTEGVGKR